MIENNIVQNFVQGFFNIIGQQWGQLDKHRVEKYFVLVRYFITELVQWCVSNKQVLMIPSMVSSTFESNAGMGLKLHLVDVITDHFPLLIRDDSSLASKIFDPFIKVYCHSHHMPSLVKRIGFKIIDPLLETEGDVFFGSNIDISLHFLHDFMIQINAGVKKPDPNREIENQRLKVSKECRKIIVEINKAKAALGRPSAKTT